MDWQHTETDEIEEEEDEEEVNDYEENEPQVDDTSHAWMNGDGDESENDLDRLNNILGDAPSASTPSSSTTARRRPGMLPFTPPQHWREDVGDEDPHGMEDPWDANDSGDDNDGDTGGNDAVNDDADAENEGGSERDRLDNARAIWDTMRGMRVGGNNQGGVANAQGRTLTIPVFPTDEYMCMSDDERDRNVQDRAIKRRDASKRRALERLRAAESVADDSDSNDSSCAGSVDRSSGSSAPSSNDHGNNRRKRKQAGYEEGEKSDDRSDTTSNAGSQSCSHAKRKARNGSGDAASPIDLGESSGDEDAGDAPHRCGICEHVQPSSKKGKMLAAVSDQILSMADENAGEVDRATTVRAIVATHKVHVTDKLRELGEPAVEWTEADVLEHIGGSFGEIGHTIHPLRIIEDQIRLTNKAVSHIRRSGLLKKLPSGRKVIDEQGYKHMLAGGKHIVFLLEKFVKMKKDRDTDRSGFVIGANEGGGSVTQNNMIVANFSGNPFQMHTIS
jgi:hypothetical protein